MEYIDTFKRLLDSKGEVSLDKEIATHIHGFLNTRSGQMLMRVMDEQEFALLEQDLYEYDSIKSSLNKGTVQGIRLIRSFFQQASELAREHETPQEQT